MGGRAHGLGEAFAVVTVPARGDDHVVLRPDAAGFRQPLEFGQYVHGAGEGETRRRGVFVAVVHGDHLETDLVRQLARGERNVAASAEHDDALMDERFDVDAPAVEIDAGGAVRTDLRQHGRGQRRGVGMEGTPRGGGVGDVHQPDAEGRLAPAEGRLPELRKLFRREAFHQNVHHTAADHVRIRGESRHVEMHQAGQPVLADRQTRRQHVGFDLPAADGPEHGKIPRDQHLRSGVPGRGARTPDDRGERQKFSPFQMFDDIAFKLHVNRLAVIPCCVRRVSAPCPIHVFSCITLHAPSRRIKAVSLFPRAWKKAFPITSSHTLSLSVFSRPMPLPIPQLPQLVPPVRYRLPFSTDGCFFRSPNEKPSHGGKALSSELPGRRDSIRSKVFEEEGRGLERGGEPFFRKVPLPSPIFSSDPG